MEKLAGQGFPKDQLPPGVGSRIKTTNPPTDPPRDPPDPPQTLDDPTIDPRKTGGTPQNPPKIPGYRAPNSEDPQDETDPSNLEGSRVDPRVGDPSTTLPARVEVPPDKALNALHIVNVQGRGYMKATEGANGTIVMVSVDPATSTSKWFHSTLMVP